MEGSWDLTQRLLRLSHCEGSCIRIRIRAPFFAGDLLREDPVRLYTRTLASIPSVVRRAVPEVWAAVNADVQVTVTAHRFGSGIVFFFLVTTLCSCDDRSMTPSLGGIQFVDRKSVSVRIRLLATCQNANRKAPYESYTKWAKDCELAPTRRLDRRLELGRR